MANALKKLGSKQWRSLYASYRKHFYNEREFLKDRGLPYKEKGKRVYTFDQFRATYNQYRGDKARGEWKYANITRSMAKDQLLYNTYEQAKVLYRYERERGDINKLYEEVGERNRGKVLLYLMTQPQKMRAFRDRLSTIYQTDKAEMIGILFDENGKAIKGKEEEAHNWILDEMKYIQETEIKS